MKKLSYIRIIYIGWDVKIRTVHLCILRYHSFIFISSKDVRYENNSSRSFFFSFHVRIYWWRRWRCDLEMRNHFVFFTERWRCRNQHCRLNETHRCCCHDHQIFSIRNISFLWRDKTTIRLMERSSRRACWQS